MPITPTYPGVYVQEAPSAGRTITGVSTSVTAFIGFFRKGPLNRAVRILNIGAFEKEFGGLDKRSESSYAIQQYFLNGGETAWVVRTAGSSSKNPLATAALNILDLPDPKTGGPALRLVASSPGVWGNLVVVDIDHNTQPAGSFNLTATQFEEKDGQLVEVMSLKSQKLSMDPNSPRYVASVLNLDQDPGTLVVATDLEGGANTALPSQNGTTSGELPEDLDVPKLKGKTMTAKLNGKALKPNVVMGEADSIYALPAALQAALRRVQGLSSSQVLLVHNKLWIRLTDPTQTEAILSFDGALASDLKLGEKDAQANVQRYLLGRASGGGAQANPEKGADGELPGADDLVGSSYQRTGLYALDAVDIFNLLVIPGVRSLDSGVDYVLSNAQAYCQDRNAFMIVDMASNVNSISQAEAWMAQYGTGSEYAAVYFPSLQIPDPLNDFRTRAVGPSGTLAGLYARTDADRGVWKAPAGVDAVMLGVTALSYRMDDDENGVINPMGINALRNFPVYANVSWGARTLAGADARASQWKYIPVRRVALYIEESLRRGLQWAVFEPNGEVLWAQIRLNAGAFMHELFAQGAFKGESPKEAYFVNCDAATTSQYDIDRGIVNVVVGFAPLKPAEFVIITIEQITGQSQA